MPEDYALFAIYVLVSNTPIIWIDFKTPILQLLSTELLPEQQCCSQCSIQGLFEFHIEDGLSLFNEHIFMVWFWLDLNKQVNHFSFEFDMNKFIHVSLHEHTGYVDCCHHAV